MKNFKEYPICSFISVLIIIIFSLYLTNAIKTIPCDKDMKSIFISQFIHTDFLHLLSNLYGIYSLSKVEYKYGPKKFFGLLIFLLIFNTIFEGILHKIIKTPCSIGFSGVLYGVLTFDMIYGDFNYMLFGSIIVHIFVNKIFKSIYGIVKNVASTKFTILSSLLLVQYKEIYIAK